MSSLAELPELAGFFSYSREDDEAFSGTLSALREGIHRELSAQLGRNKKTFRLWQDQVAIAPGKLWESEIKKAIDESFFFIPIVTPRSVSSKYCKFEFESFLARESEIGRNDLVFPILYISVGALESEAKWRDDPVLSIIGRRQYVDWRPLRHLDVQTTAVREQIERLCQRMVEGLNQPWISPEERRTREEAIRQQAAREARQLEAKRRDEEERQRKPLEAKAREAEAKQLVDEEKRRKRAEREPLVLADKARGPDRWRVGAVVGVAAMLVLLLVGVGGYTFLRYIDERGVHQAELKLEEERRAIEAEANRKVEQAEQQRLAAVQAVEQERQARAAAEAYAKRKTDEAERLRAAQAEQERQARAAAEKGPRPIAALGSLQKPAIGKEFGFDLADLTGELRKKYNINDAVRGVLITGAPMAKNQLVGAVISEVDHAPVSSVTEILQRIEKLRNDGKSGALLSIYTPDGLKVYPEYRYY
jgi:hypothetical protein